MGSREVSGWTFLIDSDMAGLNGLKLGGMIEGIYKNVLASLSVLELR